MKTFVLSLSLAFLTLNAPAADLAGKQIKVTGGAQDRVWAPVSVPYDGTDWPYDAPLDLKDDEDNAFMRSKPSDGFGSPKIFVVDDVTHARYGATVREGALVFVPERIAAQASPTFTVVVEEDTSPHAVQTIPRAGADEIYVLINNQWFTTYFYDPADSKPYLWPVLAEGGARMTREWPLAPAPEDGSFDHVHHRSIWSAYGDLNGEDTWEEYNPHHALELAQDVTSGSGGAYGWVRSKNVWCTFEKKPILDETREYRFYNTPDSARFFDAEIVLTANYDQVNFGDTKEGRMMAVRLNDLIRESTGGGVITNAAGSTGADACWGKPAEWCDYSGTIGDAGVRGLAVFDHPGNLRHPTRWHVRDYGLMTANCFGLHHFTEDEAEQLHGEYTLKAGDTLVFRYRVYIHTGNAADANVAGHYADYATPPMAEWVE